MVFSTIAVQLRASYVWRRLIRPQLVFTNSLAVSQLNLLALVLGASQINAQLAFGFANVKILESTGHKRFNVRNETFVTGIY